MSIELKPLEANDREQFITDNQEAFNYGALEEFGKRDDHFEKEVKYGPTKDRFLLKGVKMRKRTDASRACRTTEYHQPVNIPMGNRKYDAGYQYSY